MAPVPRLVDRPGVRARIRDSAEVRRRHDGFGFSGSAANRTGCALQTEFPASVDPIQPPSRKPAVRGRPLLAGCGCTRSSAVRRANANGRFSARQSGAARPGVDPQLPVGRAKCWRQSRRWRSRPFESMVWPAAVQREPPFIIRHRTRGPGWKLSPSGRLQTGPSLP
jgi:hypothetical protein